MTAFLAMGGYAWYVWMAYGAVALGVVVEILAVRARRRHAFERMQMTATVPAQRPRPAGGAR